MTTLTPLEEEVLKKLLAGKAEWLAVLRGQAYAARVRSRDFTGAGFFTRFSVAEDAPRIVGDPSFKFGDVSAHIAGLHYGAGFLLSVSGGRLDVLEGSSYEEQWPKNIRNFRAYYSSGMMRDEGELERSIVYATSSSHL